MLNVSQLLNEGYKELFENKNCVIKDAKGTEVLNILMKGKSFVFDFMNKEQAKKEEDNNSIL